MRSPLSHKEIIVEGARQILKQPRQPDSDGRDRNESGPNNARFLPHNDKESAYDSYSLLLVCELLCLKEIIMALRFVFESWRGIVLVCTAALAKAGE